MPKKTISCPRASSLRARAIIGLRWPLYGILTKPIFIVLLLVIEVTLHRKGCSERTALEPASRVFVRIAGIVARKKIYRPAFKPSPLQTEVGGAVPLEQRRKGKRQRRI